MIEKIDAVIVAAGIGQRMGSNIPKQYLKIKDKTILQMSIESIQRSQFVNNIIVVLHSKDHIFNSLNLKNIITAQGGEQRQDSVLNGIALAQSRYVLVHDAARPFVKVDDIDLLIRTIFQKNSVGGILVQPLTDTLKLGKNGQIEKTIPRDCLFRAQTPQIFLKDSLSYALTKAKNDNVALTDEASAIEYINEKPIYVQADSNNIKITTKEDLELARAILNLGD